MKRYIILLLSLVLVASLCACRSGQPNAGGENFVQMVNPIQNVDGPAEFVNSMGISLEAPEGAENCGYCIISGQIAQIQFAYAGNEYTLRASKTEEDNSGMYGPFEEIGANILIDHPDGSCSVKIRYTIEGGAVADWTWEDCYYSLSAVQIADQESFEQFASQTILDLLNK